MRMHEILQQDPETWRLFTCAEEDGTRVVKSRLEL
ncbi:MAG: hypothetical protein PWR21_1289 [Methanoculleus sp.]|nr:hypothetical protein [Methanoculleus sp.]